MRDRYPPTGMTEARLPNAGHGIVSDQKVVGYLLSESHPDGRGKARFFSGYGFTAANGTSWPRHSYATPRRTP